MMAAAGVLGEYKGSQAREVMMTLKEYKSVLGEHKQADKEVAIHQGVGSASEANKAKQRYEGSAEGEYHYAAVENED